MKNISILIPDGESPFAIHVIACLASTHAVDIHILSKKRNVPVRYSRAIRSFHVLDEGQSLLEGVLAICSHIHVDVCMPVDMDSIYYCAQHRAQIERYTRLNLSETPEKLRLAWDKGLLADFAHANNQSHPMTITNQGKFEELNSQISYPVLIKPRLAGGGEGIILIESHRELTKLVDTYGFFDENIIQEYIDGQDIDCSVLCYEGVILAHTIQCTVYPSPLRYTPSDAVKFIHDKRVLQAAENLVASLKWNGVAHIDMRIRTSDDRVLLIEINPRFWGSLEGSLRAGVNFPYLSLQSSLGKTYPVPDFIEIKYMSILSAIKRKIKLEPTLNLIHETNLSATFRDPLPAIVKVFS